MTKFPDELLKDLEASPDPIVAGLAREVLTERAVVANLRAEVAYHLDIRRYINWSFPSISFGDLIEDYTSNWRERDGEWKARFRGRI